MMVNDSKIRIETPSLTLRHNKHHTQEFYVLVDKNQFICVPGVTRGSEIKRVGPAIVEIVKRGNEQTVHRHLLNGKVVWGIIGKFANAGVWALNSKSAAKFLPENLVEKSDRFRETTKEQRKRMNKNDSVRQKR